MSSACVAPLRGSTSTLTTSYPSCCSSSLAAPVPENKCSARLLDLTSHLDWTWLDSHTCLGASLFPTELMGRHRGMKTHPGIALSFSLNSRGPLLKWRAHTPQKVFGTGLLPTSNIRTPASKYILPAAARIKRWTQGLPHAGRMHIASHFDASNLLQVSSHKDQGGSATEPHFLATLAQVNCPPS